MPTQPIAVRIEGDRYVAIRYVAHVGGDVEAFEYTVDYSTGATMIVARDLDGVRTLECLLAEGLAVPVRYLPRRITSRPMPLTAAVDPNATR